MRKKKNNSSIQIKFSSIVTEAFGSALNHIGPNLKYAMTVKSLAESNNGWPGVLKLTPD